MLSKIQNFDLPLPNGIHAEQLYRTNFDLRGDARETLRDCPNHAAMRHQQCVAFLRQVVQQGEHPIDAAIDAAGEGGATFTARIGVIEREPAAIPVLEFVRITLADLWCRETFEQAEIDFGKFGNLDWSYTRAGNQANALSCPRERTGEHRLEVVTSEFSLEPSNRRAICALPKSDNATSVRP